VGVFRWALAITPDSQTAYIVVKSVPGKVVPIRTATNHRPQGDHRGNSPVAIAISPDGQTAYVANAGSVTPISTAANTAGRKIKIGKGPLGAIAVTPDGKTAYVTKSGNGTVIRSPLPPTRRASRSRPDAFPSASRSPERQDRLRDQLHGGHSHPDQHSHQHRSQAYPARDGGPDGHRDHLVTASARNGRRPCHVPGFGARLI
jgi:YVTN family beta-propeller protein